jgi:regulator of protease activity HflC (stomatin/prohibitin superfamily)
MSTGGIIAIAVVAFFLFLLLVTNIRIVPQAKAYVIERLGSYRHTWQTGLHMKVPIFDRIAKKVSLKEDLLDFAPQPVITKDNVTIMIDTILFYQITDPKLFTYGMASPRDAIHNLTATTLRNIIGELELDQTLTSRDHINQKMRIILDEATDAWGIKVNRVEIKNIMPPAEIQNAMERQMKAERERRAAILQSEGVKTSAILVAEGEKQSAILKAEGVKAATVLQADGQAQAIIAINKAYAQGLQYIKDVGPDNKIIAIKSLETLEKMANGQATKIIIPSEMQGLASLTATLKELVSDVQPPEKKAK